jgi:predicted nucleic acid-binding protein
MVLVDTSVWIDHLQKGNNLLQSLLLESAVVCHSLVIGEIACGNLTNRHEIVELLQSLPRAPQIDLKEYLFFVEAHNLCGRGIGLVGIHLLASSKLGQVQLCTLDRRLKLAAIDLGLNYKK